MRNQGVIQIAALSAVALLICIGSARAEPCIPNAITPAALAAFKEDPATLLTRFPLGSGGLIGEIRNLLVSDASTLPLVMALLSNANAQQKRAIAAGLAQAARSCATPDATFALAIQQAVAGVADSEFQAAFAASSGDTQTTAVAAGDGDGDGAGPGGGVGTSAGLSGGGTGSTSNSAGFSLGTGGGGGLFSPSGFSVSGFGLSSATPVSENR